MAQIKKIADGKYLVRVSKGTGKRRTYINRTIRGTKQDAKNFAREQETMLDSGISPASLLTFSEYFPIWLAAIKSRVSPRTYDGYEGYIKRYAETPLGKLRIAEIRSHHVQEVYAIDKSPGTVRQLHASLNACFAWAVRHEYIRVNPCRHADLPRKEHKETSILTKDEAAQFVTICREMPLGVIFIFALQTGMRPEEYLALRWRDVQGCDITVQQAVQFNRKGGGYYFKELKTARSRRRITISESLRLLLVEHRRKQNEHRLEMKATWFNHDLVFPNEIGRPIATNNLTRRYLAPILDKLGKHITLYALRHSCATLLLMSGHNPKTVADRLGHSSVNLTLDVYSHVLPHIQNDATDELDRIMRGVM